MKMPKDKTFQRNTTFTVGDRLYTFTQPWVMGILNCTPDSFYDGGRYKTTGQLHEAIDKMLADGAEIIDIGGCSTRPGAHPVSADTEWERIEPALSYICKRTDEVLVSIDTFQPSVIARASQYYRVDIINDVTAGANEDMVNSAARLHIPYIAMHMKGSPENMQVNPQYDRLLDELLTFFAHKLAYFRNRGITDVFIDPGFGFGKTIDHNFEILANLHLFSMFEVPVVVGLSRKSMIWKTLGSTPGDSLNGTTAANMIALLNGADILRVHDVKEAKELIRIFLSIKKFMN